jgi:hypothetical protein
MLAVIESAALYSVSLISLIVVYLSGSNGQYPALDMVSPSTPKINYTEAIRRSLL